MPHIEDIRRCKNFDELHELIRELTKDVDQFGLLCVYDTAFRIGIKLNLMPKRIYLHAGVRKGAKALGRDVRKGTLMVSELPESMHGLKPWEAEDFLCLFHRHFQNPASWSRLDEGDHEWCGPGRRRKRISC